MTNPMQIVRSRIRSCGVTLIELMMVIAIGAVLIGIAVPSFQNLVLQSRISGNVNDLVGAINLARSEAVKRGGGTSICRSTDQATCATAGSGWATGWIVFSDANMNGVVDGTDVVINAFGAFPSGVTAVANAGMTDNIRYMSNGRPTATFTGALMTICPSGTDLKYCKYVCVNSQGRTRVETLAEHSVTASTCGS